MNDFEESTSCDQSLRACARAVCKGLSVSKKGEAMTTQELEKKMEEAEEQGDIMKAAKYEALLRIQRAEEAGDFEAVARLKREYAQFLS